MTDALNLILPALGVLSLLILNGGLIWWGLHRMHERNRRVRTGVPLWATIVDVRARSADTSMEYLPKVRYEFAGRTWESWPLGGKEAVRVPGFWKTASSGQALLGQPLEVFVDPRDPATTAVPGTDRAGLTLVVIGVAFGVTGLLCVLVGVVVMLVLSAA